MRISRFLAPVAVLGVLALTGCGGGARADAKETPAAASLPPATATPTPSATTAAPDPVMPGLTGRTVRDARRELAALDAVKGRITDAALHKDVTLPPDHDGWFVCETGPASGAPLQAGTAVTLRLAQKSGDCSVGFHGYLDEKNDPAYTPPRTAAPTPEPEPEPAPAKTKPAAGGSGGGSMTTCPDGKSGYACTSNGHPVVDGQFCPNADRGRTARATNGTTVTCSYDPSIKPYRWQ
ncbi:PASTA domain-containing protein [Streptomyces sp. NPDC012794]|uniref:PASTA domain-containing protein n=1 Tax=Streptomyces sp. NPDC012794 TaxID=3364850 RepID=UPI0036A3417F